MGMFDSITCKYVLPLPADLQEAKDINFSELVFQTKDLENALTHYEIREDGSLWERKTEHKWVEGNPDANSVMARIGHCTTIKEWWKPCNFSGDISFYDSLQYSVESDNWQNDYWIEFKALFLEGKLISIKLVKWEVESNQGHKFRTLQWQQAHKQYQQLWSRWYMKYIYKYYDNLICWLFRKYNQLKTKLPPAYKVERWLRPL